MSNPYESPAEQGVEIDQRRRLAGGVFMALGAAAPLVGIVGTVIGTMLAFDRIASDADAQADSLAAAISLAFVATIGGIVVGVILFGIGILMKRTSKRTNRQ